MRILGGIAAIVISIVLFVYPAVLWDPLETNDDGDSATATGNGGQTQQQPAATATPQAPQVSGVVQCPGTQLYAATLAACPSTGATSSITIAQSNSAVSTTGGTQGPKCPGDKEVHADTNAVVTVEAGCNVKGDVSVFENGSFVKEFDDEASTGLIVSCPQGCQIKAPFGANISPRTVDDLKSEMLSSGCGSRCVSVKEVVISDVQPSKPQVIVTDLCDVSLPKGAKALVPGGCVVSGDVAVNGKALYDSDQTTGLVVIVKSPVEVFAPFGASVTNADPQDVVNAVKQTGCGLPNGCRVVNTVTVP